MQLPSLASRLSKFALLGAVCIAGTVGCRHRAAHNRAVPKTVQQSSGATSLPLANFTIPVPPKWNYQTTFDNQILFSTRLKDRALKLELVYSGPPSKPAKSGADKGKGASQATVTRASGLPKPIKVATQNITFGGHPAVLTTSETVMLDKKTHEQDKTMVISLNGSSLVVEQSVTGIGDLSDAVGMTNDGWKTITDSLESQMTAKTPAVSKSAMKKPVKK